MVSSSIPTDRPLAEHEVEELVAKAILKRMETERSGYFQPSEFMEPHNLGSILQLPSSELERFQTLNRTSQYYGWYNEFIHKLIILGILVQSWDQSHTHVFVASERGRQILKDITEISYVEATQFIQSLTDDELRERCSDVLLRTRKPDSLVRDATVVLEDRLRTRISADASVFGQDLVNQALRPAGGKLILGVTPSEQESIHRLFLGVLGFLGNPTHHRLLRDLPAIRARQEIGMIDALLALLKEATDRT